jgi:hypothetical protein
VSFVTGLDSLEMSFDNSGDHCPDEDANAGEEHEDVHFVEEEDDSPTVAETTAANPTTTTAVRAAREAILHWCVTDPKSDCLVCRHKRQTS